MADTRYTPLRASEWGLTLTYTAGIIVGTTDFVMKNDGNTRIRVYKTGAGACTVIFKTPQKIRGTLDVAENSQTVPATTGDLIFGPFPPAQYNDGNGDMRFNFSEVTGLFFAGISG
jgi:hypothetical protein